MFFYAALEKDKHFLLDSPGIAWSPAGIAPFFGLSGVIRLPGPVRFLFPARRPRGFLDRGFRFRFPDRSLWHRFLIRLCRTEIPARRPRGFLVQGCRHRSPAWNRPRRSVRRRFDILPGFRCLSLFRREKTRRRSGIRRRPSEDCRRWGSSLRRNRFPKRNIGRGLPFSNPLW